MDLIQLLLLSALSLFSVSFLLKFLLRPKNKKRMAPMVPGAWPFIGHLPVFANGKPTHVTFGNMADVYGPVFMTKLGSVNVMMIHSQDVVKEIFTVHDELLNRPLIIASKLLGYNELLLLFTPHRAYWREVRKIAVSECFSTSVVDVLKHSRAGEVDLAFRELYRKWEQSGGSQNGALVDMTQEFHDLTQNISLMMIAGKRYFGGSPNCEIEEARRCRKLIGDLTDHFAEFMFTDYVPHLGWMDWRSKRMMKKTAIEFDKIFEDWIKEHKKKRKDSGGGIEKTFLDRLIENFEQHKNPSIDDPHTATKALCLNFILLASETTILVLIWAVSLLVNNQHMLRRAQEELNRTIGKDRVVEESDLKDLVYLQAIVKETLRLYPPVPITCYRNVTEDFEITNGKFHVPAGTQLLVNVWKIHRDPNLWSNPEKFDPERFLTSNRGADVGEESHKLLSFGLGRKVCLAIPLGTRMVQYILARFLQSFDVARPSSQDVDMTENSGLANYKATPLELLITPRLIKSLYHVDNKA